VGTPAGWYEKSRGSGRLRWWDGTRWGAPVRKWEYHVEQIDISARWGPDRSTQEMEALRIKLNHLGRLGWEMVSYESIPMTGKGYAYLTFFKRPMP